MRLRFLGANRQVTGSCHFVEAGGLRLLVDCGLFQERPLLERNWEPKPIDPAGVDALLLTHAHVDHAGLLPRLVGDGFRGPIWTTTPTVELAALVMRDSGRIQEEDAAHKAKRHRRQGRAGRHPEVPLYGVEEAERVVPRLRGVGYGEPVPLNERVTFRFLPAGHILGASILQLDVRDGGGDIRRIVFSGDLGQWDVPIVPDPTLVESADWIVMESTYGDRDHDRRESIEDALAEVVLDTVRRGGNLVIPTFAIERTQELLLHLGALVHAKRIPRLRIYVDSPLAADATEIYQRHPSFMDEPTRRTLESRPFASARNLVELVRTAEASKALNSIRGTCIVMAGSGMCTGGRIKHHLRHNVGRAESTILFVGFQAPGTLGRTILDGAPDVRILGDVLPVRADVRQIAALSGHADRAQLLRWLGGFTSKPRRLFLTHGEESAALSLADHVRSALGWDVEVPRYLDEAGLE
jgi:metallo-beta-lactamase family protein